MPSLLRRKKSKRRQPKQQQQGIATPAKSVEFSERVDSVPLAISTDRPQLVSPLKSPAPAAANAAADLRETLETPKSATTASTTTASHDSSSSSSSSSHYLSKLKLHPRPDNSRWSEDDFLKVVRVWELCQVEVDMLRDLEGRLTDVTHWKNNPFEVVRFMKGPAGHKPAERLFRKMVQWRKDNNVDSILQDYTPPPVLLDYCPSAILHGLDCDGDPIYLERAGATDASGLLKRFGHTALIKHVIWLRELCGRGQWIHDHEERMGRPITQVTIVYDLAGLNTRHMRPGVLPFFADMMSLTQSYYTGPVKRMVIIRAPALFRACWSVVKHVFPEEARSKMVFTGAHNHEEILSQYMDLKVLPPVISPEHGEGYAAEGMPQRFEGGIPPCYDYKETFSIDRPDKLTKMISTMTDATTTMNEDSSFNNYDGDDDDDDDVNRDLQVPDVNAVLEEAYGSRKVSVSGIQLGSGVFYLNEDGDVSTTVTACN